MISIREFEILRVAGTQGETDSLSRSDFDWISEQPTLRDILSITGHSTLQAKNYVGVIQCPSGLQIEILPKIDEDSPATRMVLHKMLREVFGIGRNLELRAQIEVSRYPILEWLIGDFLIQLRTLLLRGLRSKYQRIEEDSRYLKGQLNVPAMLRRPPDRRHMFAVRYDVFSLQRPENRVLKWALQVVRRLTRSAENWRLAVELETWMEPIEASLNALWDYDHWSHEALMQSYQSIRITCGFIVKGIMPLSQNGAHEGLSWVFPMERLFEKYVAIQVRRYARADVVVRTQYSDSDLIFDGSTGFNPLQPDIFIESDSNITVLDTKWKRFQSRADFDSGDLYQLMAYGIHHLKGDGILALVYPAWSGFRKPAGPFRYAIPGFDLWALPFDLEKDLLLVPENAYANKPLTV